MSWRENPFQTGEVITFCGDRYTVVKNYGDRGSVTDGSGCTISPFYWSFRGEDCKRLPELGDPDAVRTLMESYEHNRNSQLLR